MKLRNPKDAPPGGFFFVCEDNRRIDASDLRSLDRSVRDYYAANGLTVPADLSQIIEDQICERIPKSLCWKGFGDMVAGVIQAGAGAVDKALGTQLQVAAKRCGSCGQRKRTLNRLVN